MSKFKPLYKHDCDECIFLGNYAGEDLYAHEGETVIARYGSDGPEYRAGIPLLAGDWVLREAYYRAQHLGIELPSP